MSCNRHSRLKIILLVAGMVSACNATGIGYDPTSTSADMPPPPTDSPSAPSSTAAAPGPSDTAAPTTLPMSEPLPTNEADYAAAAFEAWTSDDDEMLTRLMTQGALESLRSITFQADAAWEFERCEGAAGSSYCRWSGPDGTLSFRVDNEAAGAGEEQAVTEVIVAGG